MLVLSRKSQERIQIGDQITISVLAVKGNVVRIGIEAPTNIHIVRGELPPLDKNPMMIDQISPKAAKADLPAQTAVQPSVARTAMPATTAHASAERTRAVMTRVPSLQARLNRRLGAMKGELLATT